MMAQGPPSSEAGTSNRYEKPSSTLSHSGSPDYSSPQDSQWPNPTQENPGAYEQHGLSYSEDSSCKSRPISQSPPPQVTQKYREWNLVIKSFLSSAGLTQALRGFEADMLILNPDWEREKVPNALGDLLKSLLHLGENAEGDLEERSLDERKLNHLNLREGIQPRSQSSINKEISLFLAKSRAKNDRSNQNEFLQSLAEKRRQLTDQTPESIATCARTDAKPINRGLQMKYDIAKNEEGPLRKTVKLEDDATAEENVKSSSTAQDEEGLLSAKHPGLDRRLNDIETHLAVRYVISPPRLILDRIKLLEDHIIGLERDYPPWAALHFNQPNRGWPPPPRITPIIVPSRIPTNDAPESDSLNFADKGRTKASTSRRGRGSSLHRAVMERLEVQKAKTDLALGASMDMDQD